MDRRWTASLIDLELTSIAFAWHNYLRWKGQQTRAVKLWRRTGGHHSTESNTTIVNVCESMIQIKHELSTTTFSNWDQFDAMTSVKWKWTLPRYLIHNSFVEPSIPAPQSKHPPTYSQTPPFQHSFMTQSMDGSVSLASSHSLPVFVPPRLPPLTAWIEAWPIWATSHTQDGGIIPAKTPKSFGTHHHPIC